MGVEEDLNWNAKKRGKHAEEKLQVERLAAERKVLCSVNHTVLVPSFGSACSEEFHNTQT